MSYTWQYYDLVLGGIFVSMAMGGAVGLGTAVPLTQSILGFGAIALVILGHGLFVNGPVDEPRDLADEVDALN